MRRQTVFGAAPALLAAILLQHLAPQSGELQAAGPVSTLEGFVVSIYSGDQFKMVNSFDSKNYIVRLDGVDAPERGQPFHDEAREALSEKVAARRVSVECISGERIKGFVGRVRCDNQLVNNVMIKEGWAWYAEKMLPKPSPTLAQHQANAQEEKLGLWALKDPIAPWEFASNQPVAVARRLGKQRSAKDTLDELSGGSGEGELGSSGRPRNAPKPSAKDKNLPTEAIASYMQLMTQWQGEVSAWAKKVEGWNSRAELISELKKASFGPNYGKRFFEYSNKYPNTELALHGLWMTINNGNLGEPDVATLTQAKTKLVSDYKDHESLPTYLFNLLNVYPDEPLRLVREIMREVLDTSTRKDNQGSACYALAISLWEEGMPAEGEAEVLALLTRVQQEFKTVDLGVFKLGEAAAENAYFIKNLTIGKAAPDIICKGIDGQDIKLADYRGKVVVLDFWGDWCPVCRALYPQHRELVERYSGKPFALLGINSDKSKQRLREVCDRESITWPNWADGSGGSITQRYMVEAFPTIYVLDAEGKIKARYRGSPGKALDVMVEKLLGELAAGGSGESTPSATEGSETPSDVEPSAETTPAEPAEATSP